MSMDRKKLAAVTAAVFNYIKTEEEAACYASEQTEQGQLQPVTSYGGHPNYPSVWGISGRNAQMQMRSMMQIRAFK